MRNRKEKSCLKEYSTTRYQWPLLLLQFFWLCGPLHYFQATINWACSCSLRARLYFRWRLCFAWFGRFIESAQFTVKLKGLILTYRQTQRVKWWQALTYLLPLLCWPQQSLASPNSSVDLPARFDACEPFESDIDLAVRRRFPAEFNYPAVWRSQLYQESLCDPKADSHAGAGGIAQFMKATARDVALRLRIDFDRYDSRQAIDAGAYYQNKMTRPFRRRNRTEAEAYELGAAAYNSGLGNVLKAQRLCNNERLWDDISPCQTQVTGRHAAETITYVKRIKRWTNEAEDSRPWNVPAGWRTEVTHNRREWIQKRVLARRWFTGQSWCTYFPIWGGWATAGHCHDEAVAADNHPPWIDASAALTAPLVLDAALYGVTIPELAPSAIAAGSSIETVGFPAGSDYLSYRKGVAYIQRADGAEAYEHGGLIVVFEAGPRPTFEREPVVGGQSGSPGVDLFGRPVCIVVNQNSPTDLSKPPDGILDHSMDCVTFRKVWEVFQ